MENILFIGMLIIVGLFVMGAVALVFMLFICVGLDYVQIFAEKFKPRTSGKE